MSKKQKKYLKYFLLIFSFSILIYLSVVILIKPLITFKKLILNSLGFPQPKTYYLLLQNNWELRPTGGFMGSYIKLTFNKGVIADLKLQDIYVPDGNLPQHVDPPWPLQEAFQFGFWKLRDSNWNPDFPQSAKTINWFFTKAGESKADGFIAINLFVLQDILKVLGPIEVPDYKQTITADNFIILTQAQVQKDFFPGSTQKKDFLQSLATQLFFKVQHLSWVKSLQLIKMGLKNLQQKQILIYANNAEINSYLEKFNWTGSLQNQQNFNKNYIYDYLYIVDSNLGANKANGYVEKYVNQIITKTNNQTLNEEIYITYLNQSQFTSPKPPDFFGGVYKNYLRLIVPSSAQNFQIKVNYQEFSGRTEIEDFPNKKLKSLGFFVEVKEKSTLTVQVNFEQKLDFKGKKPEKYLLNIQKQSGIDSYLHQVNFYPTGKIVNKEVKKDTLLTFSL